MRDSLNLIITLFSYIAGAWIAFKIFDFKKKGKEREAKDDRLLWPLLVVFALGGGTLIAIVLRANFGVD